MSTKKSTRFAGYPRKADMLIGKRQTIVDTRERVSTQKDTFGEAYFDVQAIVEGEGLVRYNTGARLLVEELRTHELPWRDAVIEKDWRGLYFHGTVYTVEEEEAIIRQKVGLTEY